MLADVDSPFPSRTKNRDPSRSNSTPVGYQPAGTNPSTWLQPGFETSTTVTVLLSALAMSSVRPSGDSDRPFGVDPTGACASSATEICSLAVRAGDVDDPHRIGARAGDEQTRAVARQLHRVGMLADLNLAAGFQRCRVEQEHLATAPQRDEQCLAVARQQTRVGLRGKLRGRDDAALLADRSRRTIWP